MKKKVASIFEKVNKLIFVKKYQLAKDMLGNMINEFSGVENLMLHLRRIELSIRLDSISELLNEYNKKLEANKITPDVYELCIAMINQHADLVSPQDSINHFNKIMSIHGNIAAGFYGVGYALELLENFDRAISNYEECLKYDPEWYPAYFGLSQIYFRKKDNDKGEHYFTLYEKYCPYNLYGNYYTHKNLAEEFLANKQYEEASIAISSLSEWWFENRGDCPYEISIYECLMMLQIAREKKDDKLIIINKDKLYDLVNDVLHENNISQDALFFIAKMLEDFSYFDISERFYEYIIQQSDEKSVFITKIAKEIFSNDDVNLAIRVFENSYEKQPHRNDLKYFRNIAYLRESNIDVNYYNYQKNRLKTIVESNQNSDILKELINFNSEFERDSEVYQMIGFCYQKMKDFRNAKVYFKTMYELDHKNKITALRYGEFLVDIGEIHQSVEIVKEIDFDENSENEAYFDLLWIKAIQHLNLGTEHKSINYLNKLLKYDPWNINYLTYSIIALTKINFPNRSELIEKILLDSNHEYDQKVWFEFDRNTEFYMNNNLSDLVYLRKKMFLLYEGVHEESITNFVEYSCSLNPLQARQELMKLVNTNFESPWIYWALGVLSKELWQLETASMWFDHVLACNVIDPDIKRMLYIELADCYIWQNVKLKKAIEYVKIVNDENRSSTTKNFILLTHAYLKLGLIREAHFYLDRIQEGEHTFESIYLCGLLHYRNGLTKKAKSIWKQLLTTKSDSLRVHHIKQLLLNYYFNGEEYLKAS